MSPLRMPLVSAMLLLVAAAALAAPRAAAPPTILDWGKGPAQWIMTREEARAWKAIKSEEKAREFIDLFWARRDPTPGTYQNEYRADYEALVQYADRHFRERDRRGALTERGRVLISLGMPTSLADEASKYEKQFVSGGRPDITGGRQLAGREVWTWSHEDAVAKFSLPIVEVVFIHDRNGGGARRDPMRTDFSNALPVAIARSIKNPELTTVPDWAKPQVITAATVPMGQMIIEGTSGTSTRTVYQVVPDVPVVALPAGAGKLTLVKDAFAIDAQGDRSPFAGLNSAAAFRNGDELGFVAELCSGKVTPEPPAVQMQVKITGSANGERITMNAPAEEVVPDSIKVSAGCYMVRGAVPVAEMSAGTWQLAVTLSAEGRSYNLTRDFQVE